MRGPKPEPSAIREKKGNPGHRKINTGEPVAPNGVIACPQYLTGPARSEWFRLRPILDKMGTLKPVDRNVLAAYCQAFGRYVDAEKVLKEKGPLYRTKSDNVITSPMLWVSNKAVEQMLKLGAELGIGAATRSRINVEEKETIDGQLERILRGESD
jgi:P27 family predicted phage terminase small subunit